MTLTALPKATLEYIVPMDEMLAAILDLSAWMDLNETTLLNVTLFRCSVKSPAAQEEYLICDKAPPPAGNSNEVPPTQKQRGHPHTANSIDL